MDTGVLRRALALAGTALALTAAPAGAEIVADSGFRPQPDGFSFENYGPGYANLNAAEMQRIYGRKACLAGKGGKCVLRPGVRAEMRATNRAMAGGHCYGFAVLAETVYKGLLPRFGYTSLTQLGAPGPDSTTFDIPFDGNRKVQRSIARAWYYQVLPSVNRAAVTGRPSDIVNKLRSELDPGAGETWTLAIFDPQGTGGHAVTPYALDDLGGGKYEILVYDNNWPDEERRVEVDTVAETWEYELGPDWVWEGDAGTESIALHPVRPGLGVQPCPHCGGRAGFNSKFNEITLDGAGLEHAHVILRDKQGRRTGIVGGKLVAEIPGVEVVRRTGGVRINAAGEPEETSVEPLYRVPKGKRVQIVVDGRHLEARERQTLTVVGPTFDATAQKLVLDPGERARFVLAPQRERLAYVPAAATQRAEVRFGAEARGGKRGKKVRAGYDIEVSAKGLPEGAKVDFRKRPRVGLLRFGHDAKRRTRVRYRVKITEFSPKGTEVRTKRFALAGRERAAFLQYGVLGRKLGKPRVVVYSDRGRLIRRGR